MSRIVSALKLLIVGMVVTAISLSVIALCVYRFGWGELHINIGIIVVYALSSLAGGFLLAYREKKKRLFCGVAYGVMYCFLLFVISLIVGDGHIDVSGIIKCAMTSVIAGGIGGILVK